MISEQQIKNDGKIVKGWMKIIDLHWERLLGVFDNDTQYWNDTFHSMNNNDWQSFVNIAEAILEGCSDETRRYPNFSYQIDVVKKRVMLGKPVIKRWNLQNYNSPATALVMTVRDILNEIGGTPTKTWNEKERAKILADRVVTPFETLFERGTNDDN